MQIRRPVAALMTALALVGGGATLTGCGDPTGTDRNDGTTDNSNNTGGNKPSDDSQGNLPDDSDQGGNDSSRDTDQGNG